MIVVVDYGVGNLRSVAKALEALGAEVLVSDRPEDLARAERIVLPGVGAFADGMANLERAGLREALTREVRERGKPFLGICLGMQLLAGESLEHGRHDGLGWLPARVEPFPVDDPRHRVPHMGWNDVLPVGDSPLFRGFRGGAAFYFAHSYHLRPERTEAVCATCAHGVTFAAALVDGNLAAVQFHPEKSQEAGLQLLDNFLRWKA